MSDKARLQAFKTVKRIFEGAFSNLIDFGDELQGVDRAFAENIVLGTVERKITLEFVINNLIKKDSEKDVIYLLMTGIYQILYMDRVPDNAVCDETVEIAKELFGKYIAGFVNAVLRNVCRNKQGVIESINNAEEHIRFSVNKELFDLIKSQYPDNYDSIFDAFFGKTPTFLRINTLKSDAESVQNLIGGSIIDKKRILCSNTAKAIKELDLGLYYVQGAASQEAVRLLEAKPGDTIIDVCACPGGKSIGAAIDMNNEGKIFSFDIHAKKLPLIEKTANKLGISIIKTEKHDARTPKENLIGVADRVICDVPCSGTGVMGSKPEIKYKSPSDFSGLYPTQRAILHSASKYLKVGGVLVYSTCSINKTENEETVKDFLKENDGFELIYERTFLPFEEEKEGFYIAKIKREK